MFPDSVSISEMSPVTSKNEEMKIQAFITFGDRKVETLALIDCGAKGASYIERSFVERERIPLNCLKKTIPILNIDGTENRGGDI